MQTFREFEETNDFWVKSEIQFITGVISGEVIECLPLPVIHRGLQFEGIPSLEGAGYYNTHSGEQIVKTQIQLKSVRIFADVTQLSAQYFSRQMGALAVGGDHIY